MMLIKGIATDPFCFSQRRNTSEILARFWSFKLPGLIPKVEMMVWMSSVVPGFIFEFYPELKTLIPLSFSSFSSFPFCIRSVYYVCIAKTHPKATSI